MKLFIFVKKIQSKKVKMNLNLEIDIKNIIYISCKLTSVFYAPVINLCVSFLVSKFMNICVHVVAVIKLVSRLSVSGSISLDACHG